MGAFSGGDQLLTHPLAHGLAGVLGGGTAQRELVVSEADVYGVAARVVGSRPAGPGAHAVTIADTERCAVGVVPKDLSGYDKCMTTTATTETRIGTCSRCGTTRTILGAARYLSCTVCANNPSLLAERDAFLSEYPEGYFPMGVLNMVKVSGKLGKRECDEACTSATGPACTCKCSGRHHGAAWVA